MVVRSLLIAAACLAAVAGPALAEPVAPVAGAKIDSGLGDLPHYRFWRDPSGRDPMGVEGAAAKARPAKNAPKPAKVAERSGATTTALVNGAAAQR